MAFSSAPLSQGSPHRWLIPSREDQGLDERFDLRSQAFKGEHLLLKFQKQMGNALPLQLAFVEHIIEVRGFAEFGDEKDDGIGPPLPDSLQEDPVTRARQS